MLIKDVWVVSLNCWWCCDTLQVWKYTNICQFATRRTATMAACGRHFKNIIILMYQLLYQIT